ncbi:CinA family protein [Mucilaginibacter terrenus]|uniref:CinA family protein n=1 Tax=Mucilaginibacter terrenus TaxID=2482727 RepID=A0A3E2NT88_9SPHI|nr:CinA family protein [Mucilaginibacter terrenus]RFZ84070.1 CinA family protein [Mucilaginibacter terrenus]
MPSDVVVKCSKLLLEKGLTMAFAESATAGRLSAEFSLVPDCGKMLKGGLVCYDADIKQKVLGVPANVVEQFTPESAEVTKELAERLPKLFDVDVTVGVTGLTMPGGSETDEKPVGTMFIHAVVNGQPYALRELYQGSQEDIVLQTVDRVATLLLEKLS